MRVYRQQSLRDTLTRDRAFWNEVEQRAELLTNRTPKAVSPE
jgi:hypothetical protein